MCKATFRGYGNSQRIAYILNISHQRSANRNAHVHCAFQKNPFRFSRCSIGGARSIIATVYYLRRDLINSLRISGNTDSIHAYRGCKQLILFNLQFQCFFLSFLAVVPTPSMFRSSSKCSRHDHAYSRKLCSFKL